jgi:tRNA pseudouridine38-40 synthase
VRNVRLVLQFDGTDFCGWQVQAAGVRTVQGDLAAALKKLTGTDVTLHSSSRTDSGVHAAAMPVSFHLDATLPLRAFVLGLNSLLAPDLRVLEAADVPDAFHARFSALSKTYRYRVQNGPIALPLERRTSWHVHGDLDVGAMALASTALVGEHDFSAFRAAHCDAASPVRTVLDLGVGRDGDGAVSITIRANGFLRNMVRIVAGTLVAVGLGRRGEGWVREVLQSRDRRLGGQTAPAHGLCLMEVEYPVGSTDGWARPRPQPEVRGPRSEV